MDPLNELTSRIIGAAIEVHRVLGPGMLESVYEACLVHELEERGLEVQRQKPVPVVYKGESIEVGFRLDLLVNDAVVVEVKCVDALHAIHEAQALTYLRFTGKHVALICNFKTRILTDGLQRVVRGHGPWSVPGR